jgi:hypothetical protein
MTLVATRLCVSFLLTRRATTCGHSPLCVLPLNAPRRPGLWLCSLCTHSYCPGLLSTILEISGCTERNPLAVEEAESGDQTFLNAVGSIKCLNWQDTQLLVHTTKSGITMRLTIKDFVRSTANGAFCCGNHPQGVNHLGDT